MLSQVPFRSPLPPWAPPQAVEQEHDKLLREVRGWVCVDCPEQYMPAYQLAYAALTASTHHKPRCWWPGSQVWILTVTVKQMHDRWPAAGCV
jgi:hypothetical protein